MCLALQFNVIDACSMLLVADFSINNSVYLAMVSDTLSLNCMSQSNRNSYVSLFCSLVCVCTCFCFSFYRSFVRSIDPSDINSQLFILHELWLERGILRKSIQISFASRHIFIATHSISLPFAHSLRINPLRDLIFAHCPMYAYDTRIIDRHWLINMHLIFTSIQTPYWFC